MAMRDRPPRPQSSRPVGRPPTHSYNRQSSMDDDDDDGIDTLIQDDEDDIEFGDEALAAQREMEAKLSRQMPTNKPRFRPTSAPVVRLRPQSARKPKPIDLTQQDEEQERAALSIAFLKRAAEKRKQRERKFAQELLREENEYRKKMTQKIEQANKMSAALGSKRTFAIAPDRDGMHMVKISDPTSTERVVSVENFLREFERLASVQIGQLHQRRASTASKPPATLASNVTVKKSKHRIHGIRTSRMDSSGSMADLTNELAFASMNHSTHHPPSNSKRLITKATDRALVQEELKSVLASTIELTKVLQDQLHELKLKGWNFSSRAGLQQHLEQCRAPDYT